MPSSLSLSSLAPPTTDTITTNTEDTNHVAQSHHTLRQPQQQQVDQQHEHEPSEKKNDSYVSLQLDHSKAIAWQHVTSLRSLRTLPIIARFDKNKYHHQP
jgi:hypothetical protein